LVSEDEMNSIKEFSKTHEYIKLVRSTVMENEVVTVNAPVYCMDGNVVRIKKKCIKMNLPSLGYMMVAELEGDKLMSREISVRETELVFDSNFQLS
jgi:hypothetical protein